MAFAYRFRDGSGNGPFESEKFDTENDALMIAAERRHQVDEVLAFDAQGNLQGSSIRESITVSDAPAPAEPPATQEQTGGVQPDATPLPAGFTPVS